MTTPSKQNNTIQYNTIPYPDYNNIYEVIARHTYIISLRIWSHFTHKPGNPKLINNKLFQYLVKFYSDNLNDGAIDKYKNDTGIYEAYHI